jgi:hypothetical protein
MFRVAESETLGGRFFAAVGHGFTTLGPNSLERLLDQRDALLEAAKHARTCVPVPSDCHAKLTAAIEKAESAE